MHSSQITKPFLLFILLFSSFLGWGQISVYTNSVTGNDTSGDGSYLKPFKSFSKAYEQTPAGSKLMIQGTFTWTDSNEYLDIGGEGFIIDKNISIIGESPLNTIVQAATVSMTADKRVFKIKDKITVIFKNFSIKNGVGFSGWISKRDSRYGGVNTKLHVSSGATYLVYQYGGAVGCDSGDCTGTNLTLDNMLISDNYSSGGAGSNSAGLYTEGSISVTNSTFQNNQVYSAYRGSFHGIALNLQAYATIPPKKRNIVNTTFYNNTSISTSSKGSAAVFVDRHGANIFNSTFVNNSGGITTYALNDGEDELYIVNSVFVESEGNDLYNLSHSSDNTDSVKIFNSVFGGTITFEDGDDPYTYSNTLTGTTIIATGLQTPTTYSNNFLKTPVLKFNSGNLINQGVSGNFGSSASGGSYSTTSKDQYGATRDNLIDIGSYEFGGTLSPTVSISLTDNTLKFGVETKKIKFLLSDYSDSFEINDISITSSGTSTGTISNFTSTNSFTYLIDYQAPENFFGTITVTIEANKFQDLNSNYNISSSQEFDVDTTSPEVSTFTSSDVNLNATETASLGVTLTQSSTTFIASDISLESSGDETGSLSVYTAVNSKTYSLLYTPPTNFSGTMTLTIPAGSFENTESPAKANTQTSTLVLNIDTIAPTISTLSHTHEDAVVRDADTAPFFVTFTEPMVTSPKISIGSVLTNASMTVSPSTNSQTWTYNWDVPAGSDGIVTATVTATDLFGNYYGGSESLSLTIDNVSPTITLTENDADDILVLGETVIFTTSVNEAVSGVPSMTIVTTAGTTNDVLTPAGSNWTYSYTAPTNYSGVVSFTVSLLDIAGNISTATKTLTVDSITASITLITSPNSNGKYTDDDANPANSDTISITLTFSEDVVVSSGTYPYLTLNTLPSQNAFYAGGSGTQTLTFSYRVIDGAQAIDLSVTGVVLPSGVTIKDQAGNPVDLTLNAINAIGNNLLDEKDIEIRALDPVFTSLTATTNNVMGLNGATDSNTVTYNFTSDIPLLSSSVSMTFGGFSTQPSLTQTNAGNTYSLSFTVGSSMPEGALNLTLFATDTHSSTLVPEENRSADYLQSAFNQTLIIDRTAPIITPTALSSPENSITGPRVQANEPVFNFTIRGGADQAQFTINAATGVLSFVNVPDFEAPADTDADNVYEVEVQVTDIVGLTATQTIAVTVTDLSEVVDADGDGVLDDSDNCPFLANPLQADADLDGIGDLCDPDNDNDGVVDTDDLFPFDKTEWIDTDGDGIGNNADLDDDGDGQLDIYEIKCGSDALNASNISLDTDLDGIPDCADMDDDNDGVVDTEDIFPLDPSEWTDTDQDGIGNNIDSDDDNDGYSDEVELSCGGNSLNAILKPRDLDQDGLADCEDPDIDGDGFLNSEDQFPEDPTEWLDTDLDGFGNEIDLDDDNDGYLDTEDIFPLDPNEWIDQDQDGLGDNEDRDDNADGFDDDTVLASGVLTPNTNGLESTWKVINLEQYPNARVRVYNPNAIEVFSAVNYKNDWRGTFKGTNKLLPAGSYYYIIDLNLGALPKTGWLYLNY